jgi:hypothetical protein
MMRIRVPIHIIRELLTALRTDDPYALYAWVAGKTAIAATDIVIEEGRDYFTIVLPNALDVAGQNAFENALDGDRRSARFD